MKKSLVALAALAVVGAASAQSSVTLWGVVDNAVGRYSGNNVSATKMNSSGLSSSQLGFRGVEDLGGGMSAGFWLEAGHNPDAGLGQGTTANNQAASTNNGGLTFNRRSTLSLIGGFGEVRLGRDYTPAFWNLTVFDPFGTLGAAQSSNLNLAGTAPQTGVRASNSITYLYNHGANATSAAGNAGVYAQVSYHMGENASGAATSSDGNGYGLRVGYRQGPLNAAFATGKTTFAANGNFTQTNLGASYNIGMADLIANYNRNNSGVAGTRATTILLGAKIAVGAGYIPVSYNRMSMNNAANTKASQFGIGYVHNLSKRTSVYTTYARLGNANGAAFGVGGGVGSAVNGASSGLELGVKHSF
jgi:predicted porin